MWPIGLREFLVAGQCCGEGKEAQEVGGPAVVADVEPVVAGQPGDRSSNDPSMPAEAVAALDAFADDPDAEASVSDLSA